MRSLAFLSLMSLVSAHGLITAAKGNAGGAGSGLGFVPGSSGTSQADVTVFKGNSVCGQTAAGGTNSISTGTQKVLSQNGGTLPQVTAGGSLSMTLHQVNADGAGPYTCQISTDATGTTFTNLQVNTQVPGNNGVSGANNQDFPLVVSMPANLQCTGTVAGQSQVCLVRCKNPSGGGPFGGCVPIQQSGAATTGSTNTGTNTNGNTNSAAAAVSPAATSVAAPATSPATSAASAAAPAASGTTTTGTGTTGKGNGKGKGKHHGKGGQASAAAAASAGSTANNNGTGNGASCSTNNKREVEWEA